MPTVTRCLPCQIKSKPKITLRVDMVNVEESVRSNTEFGNVTVFHHSPTDCHEGKASCHSSHTRNTSTLIKYYLPSLSR